MTINPTKLQSTNAVGISQHFQELRLLSSNLFHASRLGLPNLLETKGYLSIIDWFWSRVRRKFLFECTRDKGKLSKSKIKDSWLKSQAKYQSWAKRIVRGTLASLWQSCLPARPFAQLGTSMMMMLMMIKVIVRVDGDYGDHDLKLGNNNLPSPDKVPFPLISNQGNNVVVKSFEIILMPVQKQFLLGKPHFPSR